MKQLIFTAGMAIGMAFPLVASGADENVPNNYVPLKIEHPRKANIAASLPVIQVEGDTADKHESSAATGAPPPTKKNLLEFNPKAEQSK